MSPGATLVWLRDDLRLADNPALAAAAETGAPIVVAYLLDEESDGIRPLGSASKWWLHHSLASLAASIAALGGSLVLRRGAAATEIPRLVTEFGATAVYWNRRYSKARNVDAAIKTALRASGVEVRSFHANLLWEPWTVSTGQGEPFKVFTPFWRACLSRGVDRLPLESLSELAGPRVRSDELEAWELLPTHPDWAGGLRETWSPGEHSALERLEAFAAGGLEHYHRRDEPSVPAGSTLSPHLRFGELSALQVFDRFERGALTAPARANAAKFLSELGWREFNWHILFHFPDLATRNFRSGFDAFPWEQPDAAELDAWRHGRTGIPVVDAGMRELWHTGTMHNRVRMVAASFLVKNLLVDWRVGEQWFWDTLVDADEASNPGNWQWVAGSGADPAPYFRIFNPLLQGKKFDPDEIYVRRWIPELGTSDYPEPIVDLGASRQRALRAYEVMKGASA
jgi:deoxyribodipyrimidine photo-lyase